MNNDAFEKKAQEIYAQKNKFLEKEWGYDCCWMEINQEDFEKVISQALKETYEAATKAALGSRVVLPERKDTKACWLDRTDKTLTKDEIHFANLGFNECLDSIKLLPLTAEQVCDLLPIQEDFVEKFCEIFDGNNGTWEDNAETLFVWLIESIKKRLGGV